MDRFEYLVDLRKQIAAEISGVDDAAFSLFWDDTRPNWLTRARLLGLFDLARDGAEAFGLYVAARHCECGSKSHCDTYMMAPVGGRPIAYRDPAFIWSDPLDQGEQDCPCPCTSSNRHKRHWVIRDVLFDKTADRAFCDALERILGDLYEAKQRAGDKKPRSGIREHLLRALLAVNDQILPETIDEYIAQHSAPYVGA